MNEIEGEHMKAVAYCRVSTNELDQKNSLQNQMRHYQELFKKQEYSPVNVGLLYRKNGTTENLEGIFADEGITGTKKKNRKAMDYLLKCAENREFDVVYCKNVPRFARSVEDGAGDLKRLKQLGIKVIFEDGNMNYHDHESTINMFLAIAQEESRAKSVACKFGIRKAQEMGKWTSNCPYGYDRIDGYLKINLGEAEIVKQIYSYYAEKGFGHNKIVRWLNDENIPTKKGGIWRQQHVKHILTNPLYKGIQTTHKTENKDVNVFLKQEIPEYDWIKHNKEELRIVSDELWQRTQDSYKRRTEEYFDKHRYSDKNLLSTVCTCGKCKGVLKRKRKRTKVNQKMVYLDGYEWVCQNNDMYGSKVCKYRHAIDEEVLIQFCKEKIVGYREHKELLEIILQKYFKVFYNQKTTTRLAEITEKIDELKSEFKNQIRLNSKGILCDEDLEEFTHEYRINLLKLENEEHKLKNLEKEIEEVKRKYKDFIEYIDNVDIENLTNSDLKKIFKKIKVVTIEGVCDKKGEINRIYKSMIQMPYHWYNENKNQIKCLIAEHMFMDIEENTILNKITLGEVKKLKELNILR